MNRKDYCPLCHLVVVEHDSSRVCRGSAVLHRHCVANGIRAFLRRYDGRLADEFVSAFRRCADNRARARAVGEFLKRCLDRRSRGIDLERCWCQALELAHLAEAVYASRIVTAI